MLWKFQAARLHPKQKTKKSVKRLKVMNTNNVKWASNEMGIKLLSPKTPTSEPYYYKWGEVQISVSDTHYDNNRQRSRVEPTVTLEMWCGTGTIVICSLTKN